MERVAILAVLLSGCAASTVAGAGAVTSAALATSAMQRKAGGCYAMCTGDTSCNPISGLCERNPCGVCAADQHCETTFTESRCMPGAPSDVVTTAPGTGRTVRAAPPPPPTPSGPPEVTPAAEQNPPSHK